MNRKELFKQLNSLCYEMNESYNINRGGCCFVAATIAEQFERFNIPFTVIQYDGHYHYAVRVSDRIINRDGCEYRIISSDKFISSEELYDEYYGCDWNDYYNRKWNLIVKTRIRALFNKYGNKRT